MLGAFFADAGEEVNEIGMAEMAVNGREDEANRIGTLPPQVLGCDVRSVAQRFDGLQYFSSRRFRNGAWTIIDHIGDSG